MQEIFSTLTTPDYRIGFYISEAVAILFSVLLLVATFNETITSKTKRLLLLPWLICDVINIVTMAIASVALLAMGSIFLASTPTDENVVMGSVLIPAGAACLVLGKHLFRFKAVA